LFIGPTQLIAKIALLDCFTGYQFTMPATGDGMFKQRRPKPVIIEDYHSLPGGGSHCQRQRQRRLRRLGTLLMLLIALSSLLWQRAHAQVLADEFRSPALLVDKHEQREPAAGQLWFTAAESAAKHTALLLASEVDFTINGLLARVQLRQRFTNTSAAWVEGVYVFPLPETAAIRALTITIGERVIQGQIAEKSAAKQLYQQARDSGRKAGLVEQQRLNLFTTRIANIAPGEHIDVQLEYLQQVDYQHGHFSLRFPMTITPRYFPGVPLRVAAQRHTEKPDELSDTNQPWINTLLQVDQGSGWALDTDQVPDASQLSPYLNPLVPSSSRLVNPITITASIDMGMPLQRVDSAYHSILLSSQANQYQLRLSQGQVSMDQDFVLSWQPKASSEPRAALFSETLDGESYLLLMVLPPTAVAGSSLPAALPREVIYVIDSSGSMDGSPIRQAKQSLLMALNKLRPGDRFNIIEFNSRAFALFDKAVVANAGNLQSARHYVNAIQSGGGTEMAAALSLALRDQEVDEAVRQVIFITDGAVGNEQALFQLVQQKLAASRLFTVGIGSAPNSYFMRKAAQFGRGSFTHIGDTADIQQGMSQLFDKLDSPQMSAITMQWPIDDVEVYPPKSPDLYAGEPLLLSAKLSSTLSASERLLSIQGMLHDQSWQQTVDISQRASQSGIASLWARQKISHLLDQKTAGRDAAAVRDDVLAVALQHQLISPYSSFIAVEQQPSRADQHAINRAAVSNARPKGQGPQQFTYPATATRGRQSVLVGLSLLLLLFALHCSRPWWQHCKAVYDCYR
jgi:Ca-activated chloride channel family protein